jgi:hypothetical protein
MSEKNLYQRIVAIMQDMGGQAKTGQTSYGDHYKYHKIDDIDDALRRALVKHNVVAVIVRIDRGELQYSQGQDKYGKPRTTWSADCMVEIQLINADTPAERLSIFGWGQGLDYSDKASGKAISYAAKAAYLSAFHLRGQPDSESDDIPRSQPQQDHTPKLRPKPKATSLALSPDDLAFVERSRLGFEAAKTQADIDDIVAKVKQRSLPEKTKESLRVAWKSRQNFLKKEQENATSGTVSEVRK